MKKISVLLLALTFRASFGFAAEGDLRLPGEKWLAAFDKYACVQNQVESTPRPEIFEKMNLQFERLSTDNTLKNILLVATFNEGASVCRYSAILKGDTNTHHVVMVNSLAFSVDGGATCAERKLSLDQLLADFDYQYYGHPHRVAFLFPLNDSQALCGKDATYIAPEFVVKGRVP